MGMGMDGDGDPSPPYLEEGEAKEEKEHVDDLVDDKAPGEAHHDEHAGTDADPVFGIEIPHQDPQRLQHVPLPAGLCEARKGLQAAARGGHVCLVPPSPAAAHLQALASLGMLSPGQGPSGWVMLGALTRVRDGHLQERGGRAPPR